MAKKAIVIAASVCALAAAGALGLGASAHGQEKQATLPAAPSPRILVAPGVTEGASDVAALSFQANGSVREVLVDTGVLVKKGELLARLDDRLARAQLDEAVATLAATQARRDAIFAGSRASERAMAEAELAEVRATVADRNRELERSERLFAQNAVGSAEVDSFRTAAEIARARKLSAEARAKLVREGSRAEALREAAATLTAAEARRREAETLLSHTELRAPRDGIILRRKIEPGVQVTLLPPTIAFTLVDISKLRVRAEIDEQDLGLIQVGDPAWTSAPAFGERRFPGKIVQIMNEFGRKQITTGDPHARNDTRVIEALVELDGPLSLPIGLRMDTHISPQNQKP